MIRGFIGLIEPSEQHYYQQLWTLVGGGVASREETVRPQASVMPQGVAWIKDAAVDVAPECRSVALSVAPSRTTMWWSVPSIQWDWDKVPGTAEAMESRTASSNYRYELAPKTWDMSRNLTSGRLLLAALGSHQVNRGPVKIAYLAADYWRKQGVLEDIRVVMVLPTPGMFGVIVFAAALNGWSTSTASKSASKAK